MFISVCFRNLCKFRKKFNCTIYLHAAKKTFFVLDDFLYSGLAFIFFYYSASGFGSGNMFSILRSNNVKGHGCHIVKIAVVYCVVLNIK